MTKIGKDKTVEEVCEMIRSFISKKLADMIAEMQEPEDLTPSENSIVEKFLEPAESYCSVKQLFWLRDIKDKYL